MLVLSVPVLTSNMPFYVARLESRRILGEPPIILQPSFGKHHCMPLWVILSSVTWRVTYFCASSIAERTFPWRSDGVMAYPGQQHERACPGQLDVCARR